MRIVVLFNLKPGVDPAAYEAWARGTDIPGVNALSSVDRFSVHRATGLFGSDAPSPYQYVEVIDIAALDPFVAEISTEAFQKVAAAFGDFAENPQFIMTEDL
ncbi:REDY-like protein HapK [Novosphingobium sp.]|uniref:REDY-like protein HapK n=1 Tax=Novosphingobium sp. TaxID=1874826 RepID=UPI001EC48BB1|nr:REDY-like protein HapK [Novosphingobium sp.]MBK6802054.1 REDY-like protein HapK [Novosphingobium sp.]MBK9009334.1 REDY-like protein HapK [Novosphingobium sp.]